MTIKLTGKKIGECETRNNERFEGFKGFKGFSVPRSARKEKAWTNTMHGSPQLPLR